MANDNSLFLSKAALYELVTAKIQSLGFSALAKNYRVDATRLALEVCLRPQIHILEFSNLAICGILYKGANSTTIGLNARRSAGGKNFDCAHELIHYWFHNQNEFCCMENIDNNWEWQANEGAAQLLMPYQNFIPNYCHLYDRFYRRMPPHIAYNTLVATLAKNYMAGEMAVRFRIESLKGEISQYLSGVAVDDIKVSSRREN